MAKPLLFLKSTDFQLYQLASYMSKFSNKVIRSTFAHSFANARASYTVYNCQPASQLYCLQLFHICLLIFQVNTDVKSLRIFFRNKFYLLAQFDYLALSQLANLFIRFFVVKHSQLPIKSYDKGQLQKKNTNREGVDDNTGLKKPGYGIFRFAVTLPLEIWRKQSSTPGDPTKLVLCTIISIGNSKAKNQGIPEIPLLFYLTPGISICSLVNTTATGNSMASTYTVWNFSGKS